MKVGLLFEWDSLIGVYRSPELARRAAARKAGKRLSWKEQGPAVQCVQTSHGAIHFEVNEEEVLES